VNRRSIAILALIPAIGLALLFIVGSFRYGSPQGLARRILIRLDLIGRPASPLMPTSLPTQEPEPSQAQAPPSATFAPEIDATATPMRAPSPTSTPAHRPAEAVVELEGFRHEWQTWNNCGPATLSMYLSFYGSMLTQADVGPALRPNPEDKHVSPEELAEFARAQGYRATVRTNGTPEKLKLFLSNGVPVMMPTWHENKPGDGMGHYRLVTGYDDSAEEWTLYDSLAATDVARSSPYRGIKMPYERLLELWRVYNYRYLLVYTKDLEPIVFSILGDDLDDEAMWASSLARARQDVAEHPEDPHVWFNLGTNLVAVEQYAEAAEAYDVARRLGLPWRMLWYQFGPFSAYYHAGRYDEVVALADATLELTTHVEELHYWKAMGLLATGDREGAMASLRTALEFRPGYAAAAEALSGLEP